MIPRPVADFLLAVRARVLRLWSRPKATAPVTTETAEAN
jgi:hypothetical protein